MKDGALATGAAEGVTALVDGAVVGMKDDLKEGAVGTRNGALVGDAVLLTDGAALVALVGPLMAHTPLQVVLETLVCGTKVCWMRKYLPPTSIFALLAAKLDP